MNESRKGHTGKELKERVIGEDESRPKVKE